MTAPLNPVLGGTDKAAIMVMLLAEEDASRILGQLTPDELRQLAGTMCGIGEIEPQAIADAIAGFSRSTESSGISGHGRVDSVRKLLNGAVGEVKTENLMRQVAPEAEESNLPALGLLRWLDPKIIGEILAEMGCPVEVGEESIRVNGPPVQAISRAMDSNPDLVPAISVVSAFARGESVFSGVSHLRFKECDRLEVLCRGLNSVGIRAEVGADLLRVVGSDGTDLIGGDLDPQGDHRMAMAFSLLALRIPGTRVLKPGCVAKSDPLFFDRLEGLIQEREIS